jgi:hypothetical protein
MTTQLDAAYVFPLDHPLRFSSGTSVAADISIGGLSSGYSQLHSSVQSRLLVCSEGSWYLSDDTLSGTGILAVQDLTQNNWSILDPATWEIGAGGQSLGLVDYIGIYFSKEQTFSNGTNPFGRVEFSKLEIVGP